MPTQLFTDQTPFTPSDVSETDGDPFVVLLTDLADPLSFEASILALAQSDPMTAYGSTRTVVPTPSLRDTAQTQQNIATPQSKVSVKVSPDVIDSEQNNGDDGGLDAAAPVITSNIFSMARQLIESGNSSEMMLVLSAGQSLSFGTTLLDNFDPIWTGDVDTDRAFMLDFNHQGISARGWNTMTVDPERFTGLIPMTSHVTETPAPSMITQLLAAYDDAGRIAPNMLNVGTGAVGASVLELMTAADDLVRDQAAGLSHTNHGDLFVIERADGRFDYFVNDNGTAVFLDTHHHQPGLWDTMEAQISFALQGAAEAGYAIHDSVAMSFIHGQADADLSNDIYGYAWAVGRYLDMIEDALQDATGRSDLTLTLRPQNFSDLIWLTSKAPPRHRSSAPKSWATTPSI